MDNIDLDKNADSNPQGSTDPNALPTQTTQIAGPEIWGMKPNTFAMIIHLSALLGLFTGIGAIAPLILWLIHKDKAEFVDRHGKNAVNWLISAFIYAIVSIILMFVLIGILLLIVLVVMDIVFPIIAGIKANEGKEWKYPLSIKFFK